MGLPRHVFLGEDDREMRRLLADMFRRDGWEVVEASNGAHLLELVLRRVVDDPAIDVVVSDVRMPGMNGLDVLDAIRRRDGSIPVVLITAFGDAEVRRAARLLDAELLDKPFALERLRSLVTRWVRAP